MPRMIIAIAILMLAGACSKPSDRSPEARSAALETPPPLPPRQRPTIDPKSQEAALERARSFVVLLNGRKFDEAYMLLGARAPERRRFDQWFAPYSNLEARIGEAGDEEGAAGSIYLSVPLTITGLLNDRREKRSANIIFRRVNEVPGSTEAERHWHIERIEWRS